MITVAGTLIAPTNEPIETEIRITALDSEVSINSAESIITTSNNGDYSFSLVNGIFRVNVFIDDEFNQGEVVQVTDSTTSPISLSTLLTNYKYTTEEA